MAYKKKNPERDIIFDIRQKNFWEGYSNPKSKTFSNALQSALAAGYSETHAAAIKQTKFFKVRMRRLNMLDKAEKVLNKTLSINTRDENGKQITDLLRIKNDIAKHITKTLGKDEGYSERSEITGKDGEEIRISEIIFNPPVINTKSDEN